MLKIFYTIVLNFYFLESFCQIFISVENDKNKYLEYGYQNLVQFENSNFNSNKYSIKVYNAQFIDSSGKLFIEPFNLNKVEIHAVDKNSNKIIKKDTLFVELPEFNIKIAGKKGGKITKYELLGIDSFEFEYINNLNNTEIVKYECNPYKKNGMDIWETVESGKISSRLKLIFSNLQAGENLYFDDIKIKIGEIYLYRAMSFLIVSPFSLQFADKNNVKYYNSEDFEILDTKNEITIDNFSNFKSLNVVYNKYFIDSLFCKNNIKPLYLKVESFNILIFNKLKYNIKNNNLPKNEIEYFQNSDFKNKQGDIVLYNIKLIDNMGNYYDCQDLKLRIKND